jgi:hypothetical protein
MNKRRSLQTFLSAFASTPLKMVRGPPRKTLTHALISLGMAPSGYDFAISRHRAPVSTCAAVL